MDKLLVKSLKLNNEAIKKYFKTNGDIISVSEDIRVVFPTRFLNKGLASITSDVRLLSFYAILDNKGNYAVVNKPVYIKLTPDKVSDVDIDGVEHKILTFEKNSIYTKNRNLVKDDSFLYNLFDEFYFRGKIPWYMSEDYLNNILLEGKKYAGTHVGEDPLAYEILTAVLTRDASDPGSHFRQVSHKSNKKIYIGLMNIIHSYNNTVDKLFGSYYSSGITSAINSPEKEMSPMEEIIRA